MAEPTFGGERKGDVMGAHPKKREPKRGNRGWGAEVLRSSQADLGRARSLCRLLIRCSRGSFMWLRGNPALRVFFPLEHHRGSQQAKGPTGSPCPSSEGAAEKRTFGARRAERSGRATGG